MTKKQEQTKLLETFTINLLKSLNDAEDEDSGSEYNAYSIKETYTKCNGKTCKKTQCKRDIRFLKFEPDDNTPFSPELGCFDHKESINSSRVWLWCFIIEVENEDISGKKKNYNTMRIEHLNTLDPNDSLDPPNNYNNTSYMYESLCYPDNTSNNTKPSFQSWRNNDDLIIDSSVWLSDKCCVDIYYVRKCGTQYCKNISSKQQKTDFHQNLLTDIEQSLQMSANGRCEICFEDNLDLYNLECSDKHNYCSNCIAHLSIYQAKCPLCRIDIQKLKSISASMNYKKKQSKSPNYTLTVLTYDNYNYRDIQYKIEVSSNEFYYAPINFKITQYDDFKLTLQLLEEMMFFVVLDTDDSVCLRLSCTSNAWYNNRFETHDDLFTFHVLEYMNSEGIACFNN